MSKLDEIVKQFCKAYQLDEAEAETGEEGFDISGGMIGQHVSAFLRQLAHRLEE